MWSYTMSNLYRNTKYFFLNIWYHRKALAYSRPWDYSGLLWVMRDNLFTLSNSINKYSYHTTKDRNVKQIKVCLHLLDRLIEDDYDKSEYDIGDPVLGGFNIKVTPKYEIPRWTKKCKYKMEDKVKQNDKDLLFKIINKHYQSWWH